jgi:hypothetical protein
VFRGLRQGALEESDCHMPGLHDTGGIKRHRWLNNDRSKILCRCLVIHVVWQPTGEQFVCNYCKLIEVRSVICMARIARGLLGAQVTERADDLTSDRVLLARLHLSIKDTRCTKVNQSSATLAINQNVSWLEITMNDAMPMRNTERFCDRNQQLNSLMRGHMLFPAIGANVLAIDEIHDEIITASIKRARRTECYESRMTKP